MEIEHDQNSPSDQKCYLPAKLLALLPASPALPRRPLHAVPESSLSFSQGNNRADQFCYDAAGNLLASVPCNQMTVSENSYDAEGKLVSTGFGTTQYVYDAEGFRVAKIANGTATNLYYYDIAGHMTVELDGQFNQLRQEVYAGDRYLGSIQSYNGPTNYAHYNWLGTEAARSDGYGNLCQTLSGLPFGDGLQVNGNCAPSNKFFTGKERDAESGLDYFGARYYGSNMGRWMSPDWASNPTAVPYAKYANPQSLNLYSYGGNNPLSSVDTDGHDLIDPRAIAAFAAKAAHVAGSIGIGLVKFAANVLSFPGGDCSCQSRLAPPNAPSNGIERATMISAAVVSVVAPVADAAFGGSVTVTATAPSIEVPTTTMFRAVDATELQDIQSTGSFNASPAGTENKGFFDTQAGA